MNNMITVKHVEIRASFERSINIIEHRHNVRIFVGLHGFVSRAALQLMSEEFTRVNSVGIDRSACGCVLRATHGLPCACQLAHYSMLGAIPLDAIHPHWTRLHFGVPETQQDKDKQEQESQQPQPDGVTEEELRVELDALVDRFKVLDVIGKRTMFSKLRELVHPETTSMGPPPDKVKTKGAPKKGKGKAPKKAGFEERRDPSYWEHVDRETTAQQAPTTTPTPPTKKKKRIPYLDQFPTQFHPYIDDVVDVKADGNCGYRAIGSLLGKSEDGWPIVRQDLEREIMGYPQLYNDLFGGRLIEVRDSLRHVTGPCLSEKWMSLPDMGYVIATKYKVVLVSINECSNTCWTFFPLRGSPLSLSKSTPPLICIGFVNKCHWVQVCLTDGCPLPSLAPSWLAYRQPESSVWPTPYVGRMQQWIDLFPPQYPSGWGPSSQYQSDVHLGDD